MLGIMDGLSAVPGGKDSLFFAHFYDVGVVIDNTEKVWILKNNYRCFIINYIENIITVTLTM